MKKQHLPNSTINNIDYITSILKDDENLKNNFKFNFKKLCKQYILPISFIEKYAEHLSWVDIINYVGLDYCLKYEKFIAFKQLSYNSKVILTEEFIDTFYNKLDMYYVFAYKKSKKYPESFIKKYVNNNLPWADICTYYKLSEAFIKEFSDKVNWRIISYSQKLSEDFIREFSDKVNWVSISSSQKLSEDFIREFSDKVNWDNISYYQNLSEDFIREFSDKVNWKYIFSDQNFSEKFIQEFKDKVNLNNISS